MTNAYANLEMKDYVKYLGLMIDSNLSWKYHMESIKSIRIMGRIMRISEAVNNSSHHSQPHSIIAYCINTNEITADELSRENMLSSHVERSSLLWLHNKLRLSQQNIQEY